MYKDDHKEPFKTMTYAEFKDEQNAIGTALIGERFQGSKIAVIGGKDGHYHITRLCGGSNCAYR